MGKIAPPERPDGRNLGARPSFPFVDLSFEIRTAQNVPLALEPASIGQRILATIVDTLIGIAWMGGVGWALNEALGGLSAAVAIVVVWLPAVFYHLAMEVAFDGRTVGKLAVRTRVTRLDGAQPTLSQYLLRWLFRLLDVTFTFGIVALMSVAFTRRQQRIGDLAAGTTVVRQRRRLELNQVLYPLIPEGYEPTFPQAERLTDAEIRTVRAVIARLQIAPHDARSLALAERAKRAVERRIEVDDVEMRAEPFLRLIVRDHVARVDRFAEGALV